MFRGKPDGLFMDNSCLPDIKRRNFIGLHTIFRGRIAGCYLEGKILRRKEKLIKPRLKKQILTSGRKIRVASKHNMRRMEAVSMPEK